MEAQQKDTMIEVEGLTKKFGKITAVDNISFSVKRGEIFAFLGAKWRRQNDCY